MLGVPSDGTAIITRQSSTESTKALARTGHERFTQPTVPAHRRYEALRAYFVEDQTPAQIAARFSYTTGSVQTLISQYRASDPGEFFALSRPGPKTQPKKDAARERAILLRKQRHGIEEIVAELERAGTPLSRTAVWEILREENLSRMPKPARPKREAPPEQLAAEKVRVLDPADWPTEGTVQSAHAGLFLLIGELVALDLPGLVTKAGWPSTSQLPAINSVLALLALKLSGRRRRSHVDAVVHDPALGAFAGLNVLPKRWHLTSYSYRTSRTQQIAFFDALQGRLRDAGMIGQSGLNLDFHAIMSYGQDESVLEKHYVPRRSQRTRSVLTFIAQDSEHHTILYANAELTTRSQAREVIEFARFYERTHGQLPELLVFDQKLTTHEHLAELDELGVGFITLRQRHPKLTAALEALPASAWTKTRLDRSGKHKIATYHEQTVTINDRVFRQLAVQGLGREHPTLILTNQRQMTPKQLIERYGKRWGIENQLSDQIRAFHLDSLCSQVPLAVDFDVALTILADIIYRRFARTLHSAYHNQTPDTIRSQLIDANGELRFTPGHIEVALRRRTHTPALLQAGHQNRRIEVPWWGGRTLSYSFPAR
jgi:transposase